MLTAITESRGDSDLEKRSKEIIEHRFYELPLSLPAIVLTGDDWIISDKISSRLHFHNCTEIGFCHSGKGVIELEGGKAFTFKAGTISVIPRHIAHTTYSEKGAQSLWSYIFLDFASLLSDFLPSAQSDSNFSIEEPLPSGQLFNQEQDHHIHFLANCLLDEIQSTKEDWTRMFKSISLLLFYKLQRLSAEQNRTQDPVQNVKSFVLRPALEYIHQHYMHKITIKDLADICHISENHFRRLFLAIVGTPPLTFITFTRINRACIMLRTTNLSILLIAEAVGINTVAGFNRNFKNLLGVSPSEYRKCAAKSSLCFNHKYIRDYQGWTKPEAQPEHILGDD